MVPTLKLRLCDEEPLEFTDAIYQTPEHMCVSVCEAKMLDKLKTSVVVYVPVCECTAITNRKKGMGGKAYLEKDWECQMLIR